MSKLDRFLISDNLMCSCPSISSTSLDRYLSDHRPILMREIHYDYGPTPFKFFHYWFEIDGFDKLVEDSWKEAHVTDQNAYVKLMKKLRYLKEKIRMWSRLNMESSNSRKRNLKAELADLDLVIDKVKGSELMLKGDRKLLVYFKRWRSKFMNKLKYLKEKIRIWARLHKKSLNSRKSILKAELADLDGVINKGEGSDVDGHQRREVVRLIQEVEKVDVMEVAQKAKIKWSIEGDENSKYYHGVLNNKRGCLTIRGVLNDDLEREVSNEEIKRTVWDCGIDKAPGSDGFTFEIPKGGNSYFITLIPKVPNANMVKDFRPISLIGSLYKVIAKVLANRLITVLDDIVDEIQSAFVTDRQILDDPFILNEIVHWYGGLGVSSLFALNRTLMFKWVWRFFSQKKSLWVRVVKALHGEDGKIGKKVQPRYPSTWLNIINEIESLKLHGIDLVSFITPKLGCVEIVTWRSGIFFRRNPRGGVEQAQFERLKEMVEGVILRYFEDEMDQRGSHKIKFMPGKHLFFSCKMIIDVMRKITHWSDLEYREINSFEELCQWISSIRVPMLVKQKHVFEGICYIVWWYTWNRRNLKIFGKEDPSMVNVYDEVVYRSFIGFVFDVKPSLVSLIDSKTIILFCCKF
nr:RNA-directed DNA polymerase, eukaryota [Tanacetum cinerariifolium]